MLIYLQRDVQRDVIELFHYALNADGGLVLGTAETIDASDLFRTEDKQLCIYRKRNVPVPEPRLPVFPLTRTRLPSDPGNPNAAGGRAAAYGVLHQLMVERYAPPSILVSQDNELVHLSEHAGRYLVHPGGELTASVFRLVRDELRIELRAAPAERARAEAGDRFAADRRALRRRSAARGHACAAGFGPGSGRASS